MRLREYYKHLWTEIHKIENGLYCDSSDSDREDDSDEDDEDDERSPQKRVKK